MKNFITSRLSPKEQSVGAEVSDFGRQPTLSTMGQTKLYIPVDGDRGRRKKALVGKETKQKGKLLMDLMVESSWPSKDYTALAKETISLVEKRWRCQEPP